MRVTDLIENDERPVRQMQHIFQHMAGKRGDQRGDSLMYRVAAKQLVDFARRQDLGLGQLARQSKPLGCRFTNNNATDGALRVGKRCFDCMPAIKPVAATVIAGCWRRMRLDCGARAAFFVAALVAWFHAQAIYRRRPPLSTKNPDPGRARYAPYMKGMIRVEVHDFASWRAKARALLSANTQPQHIAWHQQQSLLKEELPATRFTTAVPKSFIMLAEKVARHDDPERWALLYDALWRITTGDVPHLMQCHDDPVMQRLYAMAEG